MAYNIVDYSELIRDNFTKGKKIHGRVSGATLVFQSEVITDDSVIDGPYIKDVLATTDGMVYSSEDSSVTFALSDTSADNKPAYIWVRT